MLNRRPWICDKAGGLERGGFGAWLAFLGKIIQVYCEAQRMGIVDTTYVPGTQHRQHTQTACLGARMMGGVGGSGLGGSGLGLSCAPSSPVYILQPQVLLKK